MEVKNKLGRRIPTSLPGLSNLRPYETSNKRMPKYITEKGKVFTGKLADSLRTAIIQSGLTDGMTISFHHHLRSGDAVLSMVMKEISALGIRNLTICASSLTSAHQCLTGYIKDGTVTGIETSGIRGDLAKAVSCDHILNKPVIFKTHGGRARSIESGEMKIDIAFIAASCCDNMGNMNGSMGKSAFGSMGYAKVDARYANYVIAITDNLVPYPAFPISIAQTQVDSVVLVDSIGDTDLIGKGATRKSKNPVELIIAEYACQVMIASGLLSQGFSYQAGSGGISLAVARFLKKYMQEQNITGSFASGGITGTMTELLSEGYFKTLLDVQTFDTDAVASIRTNPCHIEMDAEMYADPLSKGTVANNLDVMILSATEVDLDFNVNVLTGSDGVIMGALGGHPDTAAGAKLAIVVAPLIRKRIPTVVDEVVTISTPGESVDAVVTERGIAVNPRDTKLKQKLIEAGLPVVSMSQLRDRAQAITGKPDTPKFSDDIVGIVEYRDGTIIDVIHAVK